ncbi:MAG TPA: DUF4383 domain-containing protein [Tepidisphaeraceae bacterium]|nr:DUF4383 domain-containing protein [Tepidisphaeraceae bacterium]
MATRNFARIYGIAFLLFGILGFVPGITPMHHDHSAEGLVVGGPGHGMLFGLFHVNLLHNIVHLAFGVMGLAMAGRYESARNYARIVAISYGLLTVMGLIPGLNTMFGLVPIHGNDVWLHALLALPAAYFGFVRPATEMRTDEYNAAGTTRTGTTGVLADDDEQTATR